jgi:hypothetical protein
VYIKQILLTVYATEQVQILSGQDQCCPETYQKLIRTDDTTEEWFDPSILAREKQLSQDRLLALIRPYIQMLRPRTKLTRILS